MRKNIGKTTNIVKKEEAQKAMADIEREKKEDNDKKNAAYIDYLKLIHDAAYKEYDYYSLAWRNRQTVILKTYLWISFVVVVAQANLFAPVWMSGSTSILPWPRYPSPEFYLFAFAALSCSLGTFWLGIDSLRGRGITETHYSDTFGVMMLNAHQEVYGDNPIASFLTDTIRHLDYAVKYQKEQNVVLGKKLRAMSYALLSSIVFTVFALIPQCADCVGSLPQKEVTIMPNETKSPTAPAPTIESPPSDPCTRTNLGGIMEGAKDTYWDSATMIKDTANDDD